MLQRLHIRNYAIIQHLQVAFHPQFNIITGETGAGKSILVGALGLVLGNRADASVLNTTSEKCVVEASFLPAMPEKFEALLLSNDLDPSTDITIRREIATNGKSRSFINDTPVTLTVLRQFATQLVDLHQQFDTLELANDDFQRSVLDALAAHQPLLISYQKSYAAYEKSQKQLTVLKLQQAEAQKSADYIQFLCAELEDLNIQTGELEQLESELELLSNAETIKTLLTKVTFGLSNSDEPIVQQLKTMTQQLQSLRTNHAGLSDATVRLQSAQIELQDLAQELERINDHLHVDAARLDAVNQRLEQGYKLLKKHNVTTTGDLLAVQAQLQVQRQQTENIDAQLASAAANCSQLLAEAKTQAHQLHRNRLQQIANFEKNTNQLLGQVGMPNARLKVNMTALPQLNQFGEDAVSFLFDANKTGRFEPLEKVASGGELSRLMLSIKSLVANSLQMPTLIFDEIDTGISGEAARQVGLIMKTLANHRQIISITHQPQIAAKASAHYYVFKQMVDGQVKTQIKALDQKQRIEAIATLLAGEQLTDASRQIAKEMLAAAQ